MRTRDPKERIKDFNEVALGLTEEEAKIEAKRCLQCKSALCVGGCPVEIDIPKFIGHIAKGEFDKAIKKIEKIMKKNKKKIKILTIAKCGDYSPRISRICVDFRIT